jgi:hypothetical protein
MATYTLISSNVLASSAASVTFSSIPATYTDLVLRISARTSSASAANNIRVQFNSDTSTNYSETSLRGSGSAASSYRVSSATELVEGFVINADSSTSNTFGSLELYIPSYTASQSKPMSSFPVQENNTTAANIIPTAELWRNNAAITSIYMYISGGNTLMVGSSFYLYGISNA